MTSSAIGTVAPDASNRRAVLVDSAREWTSTTPARLWFAAAASVTALVVLGVVASSVVHARRTATDEVAVRTEPLLVRADRLNSALSDADATAVTTFLTGGLEPRARRERYLRDLRSASTELSALTLAVGSSPDPRRHLATIATELPVYSGLIETARANNRQGLPVGAAYLREASKLMNETVLPASTKLYEIEARRLSASYRSGVSTFTLAALIVAGILALVVLVLGQVYVLHVTNRVFNVPLVIASSLVVAGLVWGLTGFVVEQRSLVSAQRDGSDAVEVLAASRVLVLRSERDESLALVARGGGSQYSADFDAVSQALGPLDGSSGLLADVSRLARRTQSTAAEDDFVAALGRFRALHRRIGALEDAGDFRRAVELALEDRTGQASTLARLSADLGRQISRAQARFEAKASQSTSALRGLALGIPLLVAFAVLLSLLGFGQRIREYR